MNIYIVKILKHRLSHVCICLLYNVSEMDMDDVYICDIRGILRGIFGYLSRFLNPCAC